MSLLDLVAKLTLNTSDYESKLDSAGDVAVKAGKVIARGIAVATAAVGKFSYDSVKAGAEFDKSMSQVAATMGKTVGELESEIGSTDTAFGAFEGNLREFAQFLGQNTAFSAKQAADALNYMALAGYDTQMSMKMLPNVLSLAAAGSFDLARASDMVTDTQTAFGISADRTTQLVDEMAKAASTGNTSVEQLGDAFLTVGGLAAELNGGFVKLEDGTEKTVDGIQELEIALVAMANAGVKGSEAGTHMRNMLLKLSSPTDEGTKALEEMGVAVFDADGKMRSLSEIFGDLSNQLSKMKQSDKIKVISTLFNTRDLASAESLLKAIGTDWDRIGKEILDSKNAAAEMAETQLDNLAGDVTLFKSALEGARIVVSDQLTPSIRGFVQLATGGLQDITTAFQQNGMKGAASEFGNFLVDSIGLISEKLPEFVEAGTELLSSFVTGILEKAPDIVNAIAQCVTLVVNTLAEKAPEIINTFVDAVIGIADTLTQPEFVSNLIQGVVKLFLGFVDGINEAIPKIIEALPTIIDNIITALTAPESISAIIEGAVQLFMGIIKAIPQITVAIIEAMPQIIASIVEGLLSGVGSIVTATIELFGGVTDGAIEASKSVRDHAQATKDFIDTLNNISPDMINYNNLLSDQGHKLGDLQRDYDTTQNEINRIVGKALEERRELTEDEIKQIEELKAKLRSLEAESFSVYHNRQEAIMQSAKQIKNVTQEEAFQIISNAKEAAEKSKQAALEQYYSRLEAIENEKYATAEQLEEMRRNAQEEYDAMVLTAENYVGKTASALKEGSQSWITDQIKGYETMYQNTKQYQEKSIDAEYGFTRSIFDISTGALMIRNQQFSDSLNSMADANTTAWLNIIAASKQGGQDLTTEEEMIVHNILKHYDGLATEFENTGKESLLGLIAGMENYIPGLEDTSEMTAKEIVDTIKDYLGVFSPSRVLKEVGEYTIEGLIDGMEEKASNLENTATSLASSIKTAISEQTSGFYTIGYQMAEGLRQGFLNQEWSVTNTVSNMMRRVNYAARAQLDIHSPSGEFEEMGELSGEGYGIGLEKSMKDVMRDMDDTFDMSPLYDDPSKNDIHGGIGSQNFVDQVIININAADYENIEDLADAVSQRMWDATEQKERSYA